MTEGPTYHDPVSGRPYRVGPDGVSHWVTTEPPVPPAGPPASTGYPSGPPGQPGHPYPTGQPGHPYPTGQPAWQPGPVVPAAPSSRPSRQLVLVLAVVAGVAVLLVIVLALVLVLGGGSSPARPTSAPGAAAGGSGGSAAGPGPGAPGPGSAGWRPADFRPLSNATGSANGVQVTVEGTGTVSRTGGASPRIAVGTFLLLYVTLTNTGSTLALAFGTVTDTTGRTYREDVRAGGDITESVYGSRPLLGVDPGKSVRRVIAVDVPPGTQATQLSIDTGFGKPAAVAPLR